MDKVYDLQVYTYAWKDAQKRKAIDVNPQKRKPLTPTGSSTALAWAIGLALGEIPYDLIANDSRNVVTKRLQTIPFYCVTNQHVTSYPPLHGSQLDLHYCKIFHKLSSL